LQGAIQKGVEELPERIKLELHTALIEVDYVPTAEGKTRFRVKRNVAPPTDPESVKDKVASNATIQQLDREEVWLEADLVIAADGIRSVARRDMLKKLGEEDHSTSSDGAV
jgi:2-polyprenyl-6-methoxyphenol hydroxylase-like FAD-dependent oxidoreductase